MVGPRQISAAGDPDRTSQHDLSLIRMTFQAVGWPESLQVMRPRAHHLSTHPTGFLIGGFVLCRVEALDQVGWYDGSIYLFGEDQDLCRRLGVAGWELWFAPVGRVRHLGEHSARQMSEQGRSLRREARRRELRKAAGPIQAELYGALASARDAARKLLT